MDLLYNTSAAFLPFTGVIDTSASCLTLPAELFDAVSVWLPVTCARVDVHKVCTFPASALDRPLPDLQLRVTPDGPWLYLSLSNLLLPANAPGNICGGEACSRLCITRGPQLTNNWLIPAVRTLTFGSNALKDWFVAWHMSARQVGLAQRKPRVAGPSLSQCTPRRQCIGQQYAYPPLNLCVNPICDGYYLFFFDPVQMVCRMPSNYQTFFAVGAVVMLLLEVWLHRWNEKIEVMVDNQAANDMDAMAN